MNLEPYLIQEVPPKIYYIPDFITAEEELNIINKINTAPKPRWTQLLNRRLQNWGGIPHSRGMISEKIPEWLEFYVDKVKKLGVFCDKNLPNHILVNEYLPGQGIMPHTDGPLFHPVVATISCGSHTILEFYDRFKQDPLDIENGYSESVEKQEAHYSLLLERRSLLILQEDLYHHYLHGISKKKEDIIDSSLKNLFLCKAIENEQLTRTTRLSLTIRNAPKSTKLKLSF